MAYSLGKGFYYADQAQKTTSQKVDTNV